MGKSADTIEEFLELEKIKQAKAEIKSYFQLYGRPGLWNDWLKYEAQVWVRKKKEAKGREQARAFILNVVQWLIAVLFIFGTAFSLLYWAYLTDGWNSNSCLWSSIYRHPISPHISHYAQTLRDQSDSSRLAKIERNAAASEWSLLKQKENYDLAHQYILEQSYKRIG